MGVIDMAGNTKKIRKPVKQEQEIDVQAFNPTKSRVGRIVILILALGMFLGMLIAAIIQGIDVLS